MARFLDLPLEILIEILCYLDVVNAYICRRTCRALSNIISESTKLQYLIKVKIAGMLDNPHCKLSIADRLAALERRESCWRFANWNFFTGIDVPAPWSGVYDLTSSVYLLGKSSSDSEYVTAGVQTIKLPYQDHKDTSLVEWTEFNFGMDIIDFGTAIEEHDLLACVSSVHDENDTDLRHIVVALFRYSTQKMHDECAIPVIRICCARRNEGLPNVSIEIVGENLAVIVVFNHVVTIRHDFLHIFNWRSGKTKSAPIPVNNTGLTFLREDLFLNPNVIRKSLDVYHVPSSSAATPTTSVRLIHSFLLPTITRGYRITNVSCRSDPNPTANASFPKYTRPNRPFSNDPACAIIIFTLEIQPFTGFDVRDFVMITHRKTLLDLLPSLFQHPMNPPETLISRGHSITTRWSEHFLPCPMTPWKAWGPPNTRWFNADDFTTAFITTTAGQRCVQFVPSIRNVSDRDSMPDTIVVLDFNPWHVKLADYNRRIRGLNVVLIGKESSSGGGGGKHTAHGLEENICLAHGAFEEDILGRLPFVACKLPEKWDYDAVLLDEERILGIRTDDEPHQTASLDVIYIG